MIRVAKFSQFMFVFTAGLLWHQSTSTAVVLLICAAMLQVLIKIETPPQRMTHDYLIIEHKTRAPYNREVEDAIDNH